MKVVVSDFSTAKSDFILVQIPLFWLSLLQLTPCLTLNPATD